jgi:CDP-diacylglycerol--glycerol-3-phosphate 3-phosphatidyltransferase
MLRIWTSITNGYLRAIEPVVGLLIRLRVSPNALTTLGTLCAVMAAVAFAAGHVMLAGWIVASTGIFDVLDGIVARRTGKATTFGAFYDSTLDRVADGALLAGLAWFFATDDVHGSSVMVAVALAGIVGTHLVSYTRARAESLGIDAKVGIMQRPERVVLLAVPQALFGLALDGLILYGVVSLLALTAWMTAVQRILFVRRRTLGPASIPLRILGSSPAAQRGSRRAQS